MNIESIFVILILAPLVLMLWCVAVALAYVVFHAVKGDE
jgi:hypothetical protein